MLTPLVLFLIGLLGTLALAPVFGRLAGRTRKHELRLLMPSASVDEKTYGHAVEHYAESILVVMLFGCLAGALISAAGTAITARIWNRRNRLRPMLPV
jgi:type II secretory pathway pseudopilin PulG